MLSKEETMDDLISRKALVERLEPEYKDTVQLIQNGETHLDNLAEGFTEVHNLIVSAPAVEAEPVRHGYWFMRGGRFRCSVCGGKALWSCDGGTGGWSREYNQVTSDRCPHCGAKMGAKP